MEIFIFSLILPTLCQQSRNEGSATNGVVGGAALTRIAAKQLRERE